MNICFILVEPAVPGNIGASARAIKTMGFKRLRLVNPSDHLGKEARMLAHASGEILENAKVYTGLEKALSDLDLSIATSARTRDARFEFHINTKLPEIIRHKGNTVKNIGLVFGREESGLSNDEIKMCDLVSTVPLKQSYPSLNLSQAVMIYAYCLSDLAMPVKEKNAIKKTKNNLTASRSDPHQFKTDPQQFRTMMNKSSELLKNMEVDRSPALYNRIMERLALLGKDDIHLLLSVISRLR